MNNREMKETWKAMSCREKVGAVSSISLQLAKKYPFSFVTLGSLICCNFLPVICFLLYTLFTAASLLIIAFIAQCVASAFGLCFLLPCMAVGTCLGACGAAAGVTVLLLYQWLIEGKLNLGFNKTAPAANST